MILCVLVFGLGWATPTGLPNPTHWTRNCSRRWKSIEERELLSWASKTLGTWANMKVCMLAACVSWESRRLNKPSKVQAIKKRCEDPGEAFYISSICRDDMHDRLIALRGIIGRGRLDIFSISWLSRSTGATMWQKNLYLETRLGIFTKIYPLELNSEILF